MNSFRHKRKGSLSLELVIIIPIIAFMLVIAIDIGYLIAAKGACSSKIYLGLEKASHKIHEMSNSSFNAKANAAVGSAARTKHRLSRSIFDEMNLSLASGGIKSTIESELLQAIGVDSSKINLHTKVHSSLFNTRISVAYEVDIVSIFSGFYNKIGSEIACVKGKKDLVVTNSFDRIHKIDLLERVLRQKTDLIDFIKEFKSALEDLSKSLFG